MHAVSARAAPQQKLVEAAPSSVATTSPSVKTASTPATSFWAGLLRNTAKAAAVLGVAVALVRMVSGVHHNHMTC
jgi:hypothetical protein